MANVLTGDYEPVLQIAIRQGQRTARHAASLTQRCVPRRPGRHQLPTPHLKLLIHVLRRNFWDELPKSHGGVRICAN
jgi:hypothetical protein